MERSEIMQLMDQLEALVLKKGWPVPFTPYYLVNHESLLHLLDQLRASLQDEMDNRFIKAFANPDAERAEAGEKVYKQKNSKGKETSH
jgi:hypothetical protein